MFFNMLKQFYLGILVPVVSRDSHSKENGSSAVSFNSSLFGKYAGLLRQHLCPGLKPVSLTRTSLALIISATLLSLSACSENTQDRQVSDKADPRAVSETNASASVAAVDFEREIKPILENKCIACHACYDAPCQLKLEANEGLTRGASTIQVYNVSRLETEAPTRLHVDASSEQQWRSKGFFSVLKSDEGDAVMRWMIALGKKSGFDADQKITKDDISLGNDREMSCVKAEDFDDYAEENPHGGMPLAVAGLTDDEYQRLSAWLDGGAKVGANSRNVSDEDAAELGAWEKWLNREGDEQKLVARYIYEHLVLGHLYLQSTKKLEELLQGEQDSHLRFFRIVRSKTPPGEALKVLSTQLPNSPPEGQFYYRLQPVTDTLVYKNHIPYRFDNDRREELERLFFNEKFSVKSLPGYDYAARANPFKTFYDIPAKARYRFLLQDAEYFVRNFIRGPVCHGPIATDVIRDQFWTMFESPKHELYVNSEAYRKKVTPLLGLPGEKDDLSDLGSQWSTYSDNRNDYLAKRQASYAESYPRGPTLEHIWNGEKENTNAFLTVFRHHNNASVTRGWRGETPRTAWVLDYPLFERTYYELVVGFNVFGSVSHQLQTRLYFDLIRNGGESNFLRFLPPKQRADIYDHWYQGSGKLKIMTSYQELDKNSPTAVSFSTKNVKDELFDKLFNAYPELTTSSDVINRCGKGCLKSEAEVVGGDGLEAAAAKNGGKSIGNSALLRSVASKKADRLSIVSFMPEVTFLAVKTDDKKNANVYSILRNRMHSNVAFMLGESLRYEENLDTLTILDEVVGSYPNLMLSVSDKGLSDMVDTMLKVKTEKDLERFIDSYGVRRMQARFWEELHSYRYFLDSTTPVESGYLDINRYGYW